MANLGLPPGLVLGVTGLAVPAIPPAVQESHPQEATRGLDPVAQLMTAHRHTDALPLGGRPGKTERRRGAPRFNHTCVPTKPRPSSMGSSSANRELFRTREPPQDQSDGPAEMDYPPGDPAPRFPAGLAIEIDEAP